MGCATKVRLAILAAVGSLALATAPAALADPIPIAPTDGQQLTARVGELTFQAESTVSPAPGRMDFYVSRDNLLDAGGILANPFFTTHALLDSGAYSAGTSSANWPDQPGTYYWQVHYHDCSQADPNCFSPSQSLTIDPLPPPTQTRPADGAMIHYGGRRIFSIADVPSYSHEGTRLNIEFARNHDLASDGTFAHPLLIARPTAAGGGVYRYRFTRPLTRDPGTYYWIVERADSNAEADGIVTDGAIRSFKVAQPPSPAPRPAPKTHLTRHPPHRTHRHRIRFEFTSNMKRAHFQCFYTGGWTRCRSPQTFRHLKPGRYRFKVRAVANGKKDRTPSRCLFRVVRRR